VKLTVLLVTYNHAPYIETAIESVLMQETDFDFEVIVTEDCSTDGTREIVQRLAQAHPERIRVLLSERNLNNNSVVRRGLEAARGEYVAMLDGDDYWTSPHKLQKQVDFLHDHPECSACFHSVEVVYEVETGACNPHGGGPAQRKPDPKPRPMSTLADIVRTNFIPTCSIVFRADCCRNLPDWYDGLAAGDWPLSVLCAERGPIAYLDEPMGVYRVHSGGYWSATLSSFRSLEDVEALADVFATFDRHLSFRFTRDIRHGLAAWYEEAAVRFYKTRRYAWAREYARRTLQQSPVVLWPGHWRAIAALVLSAARTNPS
jgi:glycosyltransferase involved in cell wall biosynthesis